ncbi:Small-conductance mechanosensitive channel [hydrothermal vent metagenome]|uniref:Small-conductance mechanosensitive channel n=1 Tax=hydrothermal vent metagenome TaxID=652676 RepID=A0A3B1B2C4_9ZZZZ
MDLTSLTDFFNQWILSNAYSMATGLLALVFGWYLAGFLANQLRRLFARSKSIDPTIGPVLSQLVRYSILIVTAVIVLSQFGVATTSILTVIGAAGLAIALALQGTLSNIAAGLMLIWLRPFSIGEYIQGNNNEGTVEEIGLFATKLTTAAGLHLFVPNSNLWNTSIINYSRKKTRRLDVQVGIAYDADINIARKVLLQLVSKDKRILNKPAPLVRVEALGSSSVNILLRCWVPTGKYWDVLPELTELTKLTLDKANIEIPFNKLDVNLFEAKNN